MACQCCPDGNACSNSPDSCLKNCPTGQRDGELAYCPSVANWTSQCNPQVPPSDPAAQLQCSCGINESPNVIPKFNQIIATCVMGTGQACTYVPGGIGNQSQVILNYIAAYQFNNQTNMWVLDQDSSQNTQGECGSVDLVQNHTSWIQAQAGGAAGWEFGYYYPQVTGVGPPGMLFVISVQKFKYAAWYILNQATLDRGPANSNPNCNGDNCWADGSAGEIDFLESPFWDSYIQTHPDLYNRLYATAFNGAGRCFPNQGVPAGCSGGEQTTSYFWGDDNPHIYAAVVDSVGVTIYRDVEWEGLTQFTASSQLQTRPSSPPVCNQPPCDTCAEATSCALFMPSCAGCNSGQGCPFNWWNYFENTNQWPVAESYQWLHSQHPNNPPPCTCTS